MDEKLQLQFDQLADVIKERLLATLDFQIDSISRSPQDEAEYILTKELITLGVTAKTLSLAEALVFRDRLEAAYVLSEDVAPLNKVRAVQEGFPGRVVSIFSRVERSGE